MHPRTIYEYQVVYRLEELSSAQGPQEARVMQPVGPALSLLVRAHNPEEAEQRLEGFHVVSVGPGIPVIDWEHQQVFTSAEAAVYIRRSTAEISRMMASGDLPNGKKRKKSRPSSHLAGNG